MAEDLQEFRELMERLQGGSEEAARELFERYGPHIIRVVRRRLDKKLRPKFDSADFLQSVWASFFAGRGKKPTFDRPEALVAFLVSLARNKVVDKFRQRVHTQKYNVARERSLESSTAGQARALAGRQPTPSQVAMANERWEQLLEGQPAHYRQILVLLRQGHTHQQIAAALGLNEKTVRRLLLKLAPEPVP